MNLIFNPQRGMDMVHTQKIKVKGGAVQKLVEPDRETDGTYFITFTANAVSN